MPPCGPMRNRIRQHPLDDLAVPEPVSIRAARERLGSLVDEVAAGRPALICRRSRPLAVLVAASRYEELLETVRRDVSLAAILRARGLPIDQWTTPGALEAVARLLQEGRP